MIRYEQFGLRRLWTKEFGTVTDQRGFSTLLELSPYHQALMRKPMQYPAVLLCGFNGDTRTGPEHTRKMCAALQRSNSGKRPVLLRYEAGVDHSTRATSCEIDLAAEAHAFAAAWTGLTGSGTDDCMRKEVNAVNNTEILLAAEDRPTTTAEQATASMDGNDGGEADGSSDFV